MFGGLGDAMWAEVVDAPEVWRGPDGSSTGYLLHGEGDLDGDGFDDLLLSGDSDEDYVWRLTLAPWRGPGEHDLSEAPATIDGELYLDWSGWAADIADLDGDGFDDLAVGSPGSFEWLAIPGRTSVFLGPLSGALGREDAAAVYVGGALYDHAGASVAIGDFDGSGRLDLAIGAPFADPGGVSGAGELYLLADPL